ncbi:unnamed protein product [Dibothriocephalus latus]|uniref:Exportin-1 n=1 Tax=Dibothriocephalus latus TaxID=60516 RepID=A0A3P7NQW6_DIBLA|nr:unnamed protein product [Dibothriocephalus latus]
MLTEATAVQLLDFSQRLDIQLLDQVVNSMYTSSGEEQKLAQKILNTLKEHPEAWTRVDSILEFSSSQQTKYFALQILEALIKTRWKILKHEWPVNWPSFISDIVGASKTNESLCQNNMVILRLLSEEVFDFSLGQMTQTKAKHLKDSMCQEFGMIFQLCQSVLEGCQNASLMLPLSTKMREAYDKGMTDEQNFIQNLAIFYCTFLKSHNSLIESGQISEHLGDAYSYLLLISEVEDKEVFKICLEYWNFFVSELYTQATLACRPLYSSLLTKPEFAPVLSKLRSILISRMARPEEVLIVENEHGEVVREFMKDTDSLNLYKTMRETLVYLTHLDHNDTEKIMLEKLQRQVDGSEWSWANLNSLCWAIGSISGAMQEDAERSFLVVVIRDLLGLCEHKRGKDNKAIVASNIMYVVGQYPRFLRAHWRFLKTVITKLFEFMHETHEGVQDMACDTFIKVAQKCRRQLLLVQYGATCGFVDEIIREIDSIISDLQPQQVHTFYEAVSTILSADVDTTEQNERIEGLFRLPNEIWDEILCRIAADANVLKDIETVKQLCNILKTNLSSCKALGHPYLVQLCRIYLDMLNVYKLLSDNINAAVLSHGDQVTKQPLIRSMRSVKKTVLNLLSCWIQRSQSPELVSFY